MPEAWGRIEASRGQSREDLEIRGASFKGEGGGGLEGLGPEEYSGEAALERVTRAAPHMVLVVLGGGLQRMAITPAACPHS